jgi:excinuclease UvrABC nuclease subunit
MSFTRQSVPDTLAGFLPQLTEGPQLGPADMRDAPGAPGLYTLWTDIDERCLYVGAATTSLRARLRSHFSGNRSGDDFCLCVYDRFAFPLRSETATTAEINALTGKWIADHVTYRFVTVLRPKPGLSVLKQELQRCLDPILG